MKHTYKILMTAILLSCFAFNSKGAHLGGELLFTAKLDGANEVPSVNTDAIGIASFTMSRDMDSINFNIGVNGLSGEVTGIHIHKGAIGSNGGVVVNLSNAVMGNKVSGSLGAAVVNQSFVSDLLSGMLYINVHTAENPNGEIRGQLMLETDWSFNASLDTMQQNHSVRNDAYGMAIFDVSIDGKMLNYYVLTNDLSGAITAAHIHEGGMGVAGGVLLNLSLGINGNMLSGSLDISSNATLIDKMISGEAYINVHTSDNPNGEIRGQVELAQGLNFDIRLDTEQETTPVSGSSALGNGYIRFNPGMDTLDYMIMATNLSGSISASHIHEGSFGNSGGVIANLSSGISGNWITGQLTGMEVSTELITSLLKGGAYVNVHTSLNPNGEIRGQIYRLAREGFTFNLSGMQEVPESYTNGSGVGIASIDRNRTNLHYGIVVSGLSGKITGAHFHNAEKGSNGGVIYNISSDFEMGNDFDAAFGVWDTQNSPMFTTSNANLFLNEQVYINIHTDAYAGGELRGQAERGLARIGFDLYDNGEVVKDPRFEGMQLFTGRLSGENEVPSVTTDAQGVVGVTVSNDGSEKWLNATFTALSSNFTGAHIHEGVKGENGSVVLNLSNSINGNQIIADVSSLDMEKLAKGMYYLNIHSVKNAGGELRSQLNFESETSFISSLSGMNEFPPVVTLAQGLGHFYLANNNSELRFKVALDNLSGPITGAHLHEGANGVNGPVVVDLSTMVQGNVITGSVDPETFIDALSKGEIYLNVHTEMNPNGEVRGQLDLANGFVYEAWMNGQQEVPPSNTPSMGLALFELSYDMTELEYWVQSSNLSDAISAIHLHNGEAGVNGSVAANLSTGIDGIISTGILTGVDSDLISALNSGDLYVNAHTAAFASGEIRGQVYRMSRDGYLFDLCGMQEAPQNDSKAYGSAILAIDREQKFMHLMMVNSNMSETATAAHIHKGAEGENGDVLFALQLEGNNYFAYENSADTAVYNAIKSGNAYVNVHTESNPGGEIRGQVDNDTECPEAAMNVGVQVDELDASTLVYPNPTDGAINLTFPVEQSYQYTLTSTSGEVVHEGNAQASLELDLSDLPAGVYLLHSAGESGSVVRRIVKY